jgi:predicted HTH domain antitoxin
LNDFLDGSGIAAAIALYTQGVITLGRAFELLALNHWDGEEFFSSRGVFVNYDLAEFQHDVKN